MCREVPPWGGYAIKKDEIFVAGSYECLKSWSERWLGKCHLPALSPLERDSSDSHSSGILPADGKYFKLPPVLSLSRTDRVCLSCATDKCLSPLSTPSPSCPSLSITNVQCNWHLPGAELKGQA